MALRVTLKFVFIFSVFYLLLSVKTTVAQAPVISYQTPQAYTINQAISSLSPNNTGGAMPNTTSSIVSTFAGTGKAGYSNGPLLSATFSGTRDIAVDIKGNTYLLDDNNIVRKVTSTGSVEFLAGSGHTGFTDGLGSAANFSNPTTIAVDKVGNIYVTDNNNNAIRKIIPDGFVTTIAGNGASGFTNGAGAIATFHDPDGIAVDAAGNIFVSDHYNSCIRKITTAGVVTTFAGSGSIGSADGNGVSASFSQPADIAIDAADNLYVADEGNHKIRKITPDGVVTTVAGNGTAGSADGIGISATFDFPSGIAVDASGNIYVADAVINQLIRKITPDGVVSTIAGTNGSYGFANGSGTLASFAYPYTIAIDSKGALYVADCANNVFRKIIVTGYYIDKTLPAGLTFDSTTGIINGTPTTASPAADYTITAYNKDGSSSTVVNISVNDAVATPAGAIPDISYQTPQTYLINKPITSLSPTNTGGAVPATIYGQVSTYAGGGKLGSFGVVTGVAADGAGNVYVEDWTNNRIEKVTPDGKLSVVAGNGSSGSVNGQGTAASFTNPDGIVSDAVGNLYIGDENNNLIRKISATGFVTTLAGSGATGSADGTGTAASFYTPRGLALDPTGNLYVADQGNNLIRKITPAGVVTTIAGNGSGGFTNGTSTSATFNTPTGVGLDALGNLYVADAVNNAIRKITPAGVVTTFATGLNFPREVRADGSGNLYVTNQNGNTIQRVSPAGVVATVAGTGQLGSANGNGNVATFNGPLGLALDGKGNLFVGEDGGSLVRKVIITGYTIDKTLPAGLTFDSATGTISGTPTAASPATDYTVTAFNKDGSSSTIVNIQVVQSLKPSIITFPAPVAVHIGADNILYPDATSTNTETPITFTSSNPAVAYVGTDGQIHVIAPGITIITAYQKGDANYADATPVAEQFTITQDQVILFPVFVTKTTCDADFAVGASSNNATIPLTYSSSNPGVATISASGIIHILGSGSTDITVSQSGNNLYNTASPVTRTLTIAALVTPSVIISPDFYNSCDGLSITYTATVTNAGTHPTYQWQLNGINAGTDASTYTSSTLKTGDIITCIVTNNDGCIPVASPVSNKATLTSSPNTTVAVVITSSASGTVAAGTPITFKATPSGTQDASYQWTVNGVNVGANSNTFTSSTLLNNDVVACVLTTGGQCVANPVVNSNEIVVKILGVTAIVVPNTFTPNGDGYNDYWDIASLNAIYQQCTISVFNRYGQVVFHSIGYPQPWDGTTQGKPLPVGTYYYIIDPKNGSSVLSGPITIIR